MSETFMIHVRDKGEITLPIEFRKLMNLVTGDLLGIEILDSGQICLHKIILHKVKNNNKCGGGNGSKKVVVRS